MDKNDEKLREAIRQGYYLFSGETLSAGRLNDLMEAFDLASLDIRVVDDEDDEIDHHDVTSSQRTKMFKEHDTLSSLACNGESVKRFRTGLEEKDV